MTTTIVHGCFRTPFHVGWDGRRRRREGVAAAVVWGHGAGVGQIALHRHPIVSRVWRRGTRGKGGNGEGGGAGGQHHRWPEHGEQRPRRRREGVVAAVVWGHEAGVGQIALHCHPIVSRVWRRGARGDGEGGGEGGGAAGRGGSTIAGRNTGSSNRNEAAEEAAAATSPRLPTRGPTSPSRYCARRPRDDLRTGTRASGIPRLSAREKAQTRRVQ
jgi:ribosomal protein L25 (general stress protein Ctc)